MIGTLFLSLLIAGSGDAISFSIPYSWALTIAGTALGALLLAALKWIWPRLREHFRAVYRLRKAEKTLENGSPGLWISPMFPPNPPKIEFTKSIPIIVVANLKGGVGKTTTVANLGGHYAKKKGRRVLLLDVDFQGSLTRTVLSEDDYNRNLDEQAYGNDSKAAKLISGKDGHWLLNVTEPVFNSPGARCVPSYYTLSVMENRVLFEWLISKRRDDIRYLLARTLHDQVVQAQFDMILIDAPPRLTTGCIQSLCAATHVLIPTVLDGLSAEATGGFVDQLVTNEKLWPNLKLLGTVGNMTQFLTFDEETGEERELRPFEQDAMVAAADAVREALNRAGVVLRAAQASPVFPAKCFIPDKTELSRHAGERSRIPTKWFVSVSPRD